MHFPLRAVFLALPLEGQPKWQFQALQEALKPFEDSLRFQNPQSPHLTLQYWPELMEIEYHQIITQAEKIAATHAPFTINVIGADAFGSGGEDRVLFLTIAFSDELARLKKSCPWPNLKPFSPHITLARMKHPQRFATVKKKVMKEFHGVNLSVPMDRLRLYAEVNGVKQTPLKDFLLRQ